MEIVQAEPTDMALLNQEQNNLPEIVPYERIITVPRQTPEREPNKLLQ